MKKILCLLLFLPLCMNAQETFKATGKMIQVAMDGTTILQNKLVCYQSKENRQLVAGFLTTAFDEKCLDLRTNKHPQGVATSSGDRIAFTLQIPFPDLTGKIGNPYGAARLKKIQGVVTIYVGNSDVVLVKNPGQPKKIQLLPPQNHYQIYFYIDNVPTVWRRWNAQAPAGLLPFNFSLGTFIQRGFFVYTTDGKVVGQLYRQSHWHLAALSLKFSFEYASLDYAPRLEEPATPTPDQIRKAKAARELDKSFTAINAIFSTSGPNAGPKMELLFYNLITAIKGMAYFTRADTFSLLVTKAQKLADGWKAGKIKQKQLTPELNSLRQELIKEFASLYIKTTKTTK